MQHSRAPWLLVAAGRARVTLCRSLPAATRKLFTVITSRAVSGIAWVCAYSYRSSIGGRPAYGRHPIPSGAVGLALLRFVTSSSLPLSRNGRRCLAVVS